MYRNFFSLSELPFSISPDPKYLFMSDRHREALAHLTYGLGEVGGFALLTGEVGTGKTTISRCLMEQLPENTQAAFILNPTLSSKELLATLCDELKIRYRKTDASLKTLTDKIAEKLLKNHENDINTLLIIDEAQHLQPEVLEQLRLLTNLETNTKKLLQVILIGQPELQQLLQRRDLRQLAQRITARYHLMPLTKQELSQYIQHRLMVADCARPLFDKAALNKIHQFSQGIPRLTNLLCHSALMLAYNQNDSVVNKKTVIAAADRALGEDLTSKQGHGHYNRALMLATGLSLAAFFALAGFWWGQTPTPINELVVTNQQEQVSNTEEEIEPVRDKKIIAQTAVYPEKTLQEAATLAKEVVTEKTINNAEVQNKALKVAAVTKTVDTSKTDEALIVSADKPRLMNKTSQAVTNTDVNYQVTKVEGVSNDLLARFQAAIDETETNNKATNDYQGDFSATDEQSSNELSDANTLAFDMNEAASIKPLSQMSQQLQNALPSLQFEQHIYASDGEGWVKVNGRDRYEGDSIGDNLIVDKILPQQVILSFRGEKFSLPALTNW
ncbi:general secretion pathway protein GspA [Colwellia sp. 75C3]|uniref:AAA family ATPase n=1 Tax=Colwellia sp. 75C3 TaxID=888425 RepID=UPI000C322FC3|nr:AAA family ATPase [Colwellia sp. 75C3]PKG83802.1 general secretion pathway protein GspA [Colwellia sp. 75C3]